MWVWVPVNVSCNVGVCACQCLMSLSICLRQGLSLNLDLVLSYRVGSLQTRGILLSLLDSELGLKAHAGCLVCSLGAGIGTFVLMIVQQVFLVDGASLHPYYYKGDT